jgi:hypothetical protein
MLDAYLSLAYSVSQFNLKKVELTEEPNQKFEVEKATNLLLKFKLQQEGKNYEATDLQF